MNDKLNLSIEPNILRLLGLNPVSLITTIGSDGSVNAAPYGWVTILDYDPPKEWVKEVEKIDNLSLWKIALKLVKLLLGAS